MDQRYIPLTNTAISDPPPAYTPSDHSSLDASTNSSYLQQSTRLQQQSNSNNVVVLNQPSTQTFRIRQDVVRPSDYFLVTLILLVFCLLSGNFLSLFCLFPAIILSLIANNYNQVGEYHLAKKFGTSACTCNIVVILLSAVLILLGAVIAIIMLFVVGILAV